MSTKQVARRLMNMAAYKVRSVSERLDDSLKITYQLVESDWTYSGSIWQD